MKFLKIGVTRTSSTDLYVEVPDDLDPFDFLRGKHLQDLQRIARETAPNDHEWDYYDWQLSVEAQEVDVVEEAEARQFAVGVLRTTIIEARSK